MFPMKIRIRAPKSTKAEWSVIVEGRGPAGHFRVFGNSQSPEEAVIHAVKQVAEQQSVDLSEYLNALSEAMEKGKVQNAKGKKSLSIDERRRILDGARAKYKVGRGGPAE